MTTIYALTTSSETRKTKKGDDFALAMCRTAEGPIEFKIWDMNNQHPCYPHKGEILKIDEYQDQREEKFRNITVKKNGFTKITKEELPPELIKVLFYYKKPSNEQIKTAFASLLDASYYQSESNYLWVKECINSVGVDKFVKCPAAKAVHHDYYGGLLFHTLEVLNFCRALASAMPDKNYINTDVLCAAASLHDVGKIFTYSIDEFGTCGKNVWEDAVGHIYYSMQTVDRIGGVEPWFKDEVLHAIAAHHGTTDHGTIKVPTSLEAMILSRADDLSAKCGIVANRLKEPQNPDDDLLDSNMLKREIYLKTNALKGILNNP